MAAAPQGGAGSGSSFVSTSSRKRARATLRRGIRVRVHSAFNGRASVVVIARRRIIARGSRRVRAGVTRTVVARLNRYGRRLVRRATPIRARVQVLLPGHDTPIVRRIRIVRRS